MDEISGGIGPSFQCYWQEGLATILSNVVLCSATGITRLQVVDQFLHEALLGRQCPSVVALLLIGFPQMNQLHLLLARNEELNKWLGEHPMVLGGIFVALGLALGGSGVYELRSGVTHDKYGNVVTGPWGKLLTNIRVVGGIACIAFGVYKLVMG